MEMDIEVFFALIIAMFVIAAVLWIIYAVVKKKQDDENDAQPIVTRKAKLVDKQQVAAGDIVIGEMWTLFELEGGERIRLNAKAQNSLVVGDCGLLTWQGKRILKFERDLT